MVCSATARRRWLGASFLLAALVMLICGQTVYARSFGALVYLIYWAACFAFTGMAMVLALLDLRAIRRRRNEEERELLDSAFKEIADSAAKKRPQAPDP